MIEEKKSGKDRVQPATRNEEWSDERVKAFLDLEAPEGTPADYHVLKKAYRSMLPEQFSRFIPFFVEAGRDINVKLENGQTFLDHLNQHRKATPYIEIMKSNGAETGLN